MFIDFKFAANNQLHFGAGKFNLLPRLINNFGENLLLVLGGQSFKKTGHYKWLLNALKNNPARIYSSSVSSEPSPNQVDEMVQIYRKKNIQVVIAIGGGSVIDAGKAVSAMLAKNTSVSEYLEDVGTQTHDGKKIPFIAVPTTAGTGSEATQNAVLSLVGKKGFKKSLRHENFVPDIALVDPELTLSCPGKISAACGMDALTQLIESYVSIKSSPMTDSLALGGLRIMGDAVLKSAVIDPTDMDARTRICYGSYISGLTLANAGLGAVHGFASVIGGCFPIPHGVICGTLLAQTTQKNIEALISFDPEGDSLLKYARAGKLLGKTKTNDPIKNARLLSDILMEWAELLTIPRLSQFGVTRDDIDEIVSATGQKNNPVVLKKEELKNILKERL
ncbi:MAG: iron-containing alcohol dehydrogenase [Deltaproteobacteria bacterium]|uniref:iron-containing alcohol dehydrogenase n=1 Tax=Desulfobacula sp. TaxID=2593537 RepID=UPI0019C241E3|nr:iron-containing alcohol dehydrogenase [Candidatus Desulfobacula maris]MBL6995388.1 iron-containing alcohol dehydrogenase [Desulfobacula sp.]